MYYYFFEEDLKDLDKNIDAIKVRLDKIGKEIGESCNQSSETWHDNFGFEEGRRQQDMWSKQLSDLLEIRHRARIVPSSIGNDHVSIGSIVEFEDTETKEVQIYRISSYMIFNQKHGLISYNSPLAKILIRGTVGEERGGIINGKNKIFKILKVI
ncbi:MAG: GreA/GreB family elongation factor [Candidatus Pacebacteria bacterium]|nr:GreA/GreB family elongation factor [Candidatus Paceibacterota bacterium]NUQ57582.1 GreA/GreB family elongation factor [Candidatus Paceibacter sp.]